MSIKDSNSSIKGSTTSKKDSNSSIKDSFLSFGDWMVSVEDWFVSVFGWIGNCGYIWDVMIVLRSKSGDFAQRGFIGYGFFAESQLLDKKKDILELIKRKSQNEKINSLSDLVNNIKEIEIKEKIENELAELKEQSEKIDTEQDLITQQEKDFDVTRKQLEISKSKLDILEKKSRIWLNILARESIASIIGALLLIILSISLIAAMFLNLETTKIIESAFLLILGYFFGQAVSKK